VLVAVLAGSNVMTNRILPGALYVPWNLAVAGAILGIAARDGRTLADIGLSRATVPAGVRLGACVVGAVIVGYLGAVALPATRDLFDDSRAEGLGVGGVLYAALVRVPLGTVVLEELAFRGVLPAMLGTRVRMTAAVLLPAGLFGLWHVLPATGLEQRNEMVDDVLGGAGVAVIRVLAVVATAIGGLVLWWFRQRSDSLAAPMIVHWSTNGLGYLLASLVS
jgi:membrane protease YdiL (CAAX protease family)